MEYLLELSILFGIYGILAVSLNYIAGYCGVLSIAQGAFFGIGAFSGGYVVTEFGFGFFSALGVALVVTALLAGLTSIFMLRLKGDSLMLVSFGFAIIVFNVLNNWKEVTGGALGIKGVDAPEFFGVSLSADNRYLFLILTLACLIAIYSLLARIVSTSYGRVLKGIRENDVVMENSGHDTKKYKYAVFILGSTLAAVAGVLFAMNSPYVITPKNFDLMESVLILIMIILGGFGSMRGALVGVFVILVFPEALRFAGLPEAEYRQIFYGLLLIVLMYLRPQGLLGKYKV